MAQHTSPPSYYCSICERAIWNFLDPRTVTWSNQFRVISAEDGETWVSNVGVVDDDELDWRVPLDEHTLPVVHDDDVVISGADPTVLHAACWSVLKEFYHPEKVPLDRIFEVFRSLPVVRSMHQLSWRVAPEGPFMLDRQRYHPWDDCYLQRINHFPTNRGFESDPSGLLDIPSLLNAAPLRYRDFPQLLERECPDCFTRLPLEIREEIATHLSTSDFLSLRQTSLAFSPVFASSKFWATRFERSAERAYLFEARKIKFIPDWKVLHHRTKDTLASIGLRNRKQIWASCTWLDYFVRMRLSEHTTSDPSPPQNRAGIWRETLAQIKYLRDGWHFGEHPWLEGGCRGTYYCQIEVPQPVRAIAVSVMPLGSLGYITGLRLINDTHDLSLGYVLRDREVITDISEFKGFDVVVGPRGIHAIAIIDASDDKIRSRWIGFPEGFPVTRRLSTLSPIVSIKARFDAFKMVSLSMFGTDSDRIESPVRRSEALKDRILWYPEIPPATASLAVSDSTGDYAVMDDYQPFFYSFFAGQGGIYLRHLTGIEALNTKRLTRFRFTYDRPDIYGDGREWDHLQWVPDRETLIFPIDGRGGELIVSVQYHLEYPSRHAPRGLRGNGVLAGLKITTNRGRILLLPEDLPVDQLQQLEIREGTTITGLYATRKQGLRNRERVYAGFGVISEVLSGSHKANTKRRIEEC